MIYRGMTTALLGVVVACGGGGGKAGAKTTPSNKTGSGDTQSMQDTGTPDMPGGGGGNNAGGGGSGSAMPAGGGAADPSAPPIVFPNQDPDPVEAKTKVDAHLTIARAALAAPTPDADTALREAKEALKIDAASLDAAAYVAFAYYHKKQYDTAELVLDDVFKRDAAKKNANINYVYGLVYDHTNRPDQAVLAFKTAAELNPNLASAQVDLGVHQLQNKQYAEAQATFERLTQGGRRDAVTMTSLGSAYRGQSGDYPPGSDQRNQLIQKAELAYKTASQSNYGPAFYNLGLLYLDSDPYPTIADPVQRLNTAKDQFDRYKAIPGFDVKLYDERLKDVTKALKRAQKAQKKAAGAKGGGTP